MPRKSAKSLYEERKRLWEKIKELEADILRGSVVILKRPCTYPGCKKCKEGIKHPADYLSVSKKGKTELLYLSKKIKSEAEKGVRNWKMFQELAETISDINRMILKLKKRKG